MLPTIVLVAGAAAVLVLGRYILVGQASTKRGWRAIAEQMGLQLEMLFGLQGRIRLSGMYRGREVALLVQRDAVGPTGDPDLPIDHADFGDLN